MNVERVLALAKELEAEYAGGEVPNNLRSLQQIVATSAAQPAADPNAQQQIAQLRSRLREHLLAVPSNSFSELQHEMLADLSLDDLFGSALAARLDAIFTQNQVTLQVAAGELDQLANDVTGVATSLANFIAACDFFGLQEETLQPGEASLATLIPRSAIKSELPSLAREFGELQKMLNPFIELGNESRTNLRVKSIGSSNFALVVEMLPFSASYVSKALIDLINVYQKVQELKRSRNELAEAGVPSQSLASVDDHVNSQAEQEVTRLATELSRANQRIAETRQNELLIELTHSLNGLLNRIDKGYSYDVSARLLEERDEEEIDHANEPPGQVREEMQAALKRVRELQPGLRFLNASGESILALPESTDDEP